MKFDSAEFEMESIHRFSHWLLPISVAEICLRNQKKLRFSINSIVRLSSFRKPLSKPIPLDLKDYFHHEVIPSRRIQSSSLLRAGWFLGLGNKKKEMFPDIVKAGDPVLHEPAQELSVEEIGSDRIQNIIDDMIKVMRKGPGVGLAAPQIGVPFKIIVLEDTKEYISYAPKEEVKAQNRRPFDLLVIVNPKLKQKSNKTALFFEGCLSIDGYRAMVERYLEVEVKGLDRNGVPIKVDASGWQARILQHECDHLEGTLYVDKMVPKTFRVVDNLELPLAMGCPKLGVR